MVSKNLLSKHYSIDKDFLITRHLNGIKVINPNKVNDKKHAAMYKLKGTTISDLFQRPLCTYFSNLESEGVVINETTAFLAGFESSKDAIGRTMHAVLDKESACRTIRNDQKTMRFSMINIVEEISTRKDGIYVHAVSIKLPWYDDNNKVKGLMGCSFVLGKQSISESLIHIKELGLLNFGDMQPNYAVLQGKKINNQHLSKRETECLGLYVQGKSTKEIAKIVHLSSRTVENYLQNIKAKFDVSTRTELIYKTLDCFGHE